MGASNTNLKNRNDYNHEHEKGCFQLINSISPEAHKSSFLKNSYLFIIRGSIRFIAITPNNQLIITVSDDQAVRFFPLNRPEQTHIFKYGHLGKL